MKLSILLFIFFKTLTAVAYSGEELKTSSFGASYSIDPNSIVDVKNILKDVSIDELNKDKNKQIISEKIAYRNDEGYKNYLLLMEMLKPQKNDLYVGETLTEINNKEIINE